MTARSAMGAAVHTISSARWPWICGADADRTSRYRTVNTTSATRTPAKMSAAMAPTTSESTTIGSSELAIGATVAAMAAGANRGARGGRPDGGPGLGGRTDRAAAAGQDEHEYQGDE